MYHHFDPFFHMELGPHAGHPRRHRHRGFRRRDWAGPAASSSSKQRTIYVTYQKTLFSNALGGISGDGPSRVVDFTVEADSGPEIRAHLCALGLAEPEQMVGIKRHGAPQHLLNMSAFNSLPAGDLDVVILGKICSS